MNDKEECFGSALLFAVCPGLAQMCSYSVRTPDSMARLPSCYTQNSSLLPPPKGPVYPKCLNQILWGWGGKLRENDLRREFGLFLSKWLM